MKRAIVAGAIANKYLNGGEPWIRLSWINGLRRLGYQVLFVEQLPPGASIVTDEPIPAAGHMQVVSLGWYRRIVVGFGLGGAAALLSSDGRHVDGLSFEAVRDFAQSADLLVNISGHLTLPAIRDLPRRKVFVDEDPGFTQFWYEDGLARPTVDGHDAYYTLGRNIGQSDCTIPRCGIDWRPLRTPIVLADWAVAREATGSDTMRFTTIGAWRGSFGVVTRGKLTYGLKAHEFRKIIYLPKHVASPAHFEAALDIHSADAKDHAALHDNDWRIVDPRSVTNDPWSFRTYVQGSSAELSVAKGVYVGTNSGWFSDRTTRYLASGKPALVQDTGFTRELPTGEGLIAFRTLDEAIAGAESICCDYERHAGAARAIAERYFDSDKIIGAVLRELDLRDGPVNV